MPTPRSKHLSMLPKPLGGPSAKEQRRRQIRRERAVTLASRHLSDGVERMLQILFTGKDGDSIDAFNTLADRAGMPAIHAVHNIENVVGTVKTIRHVHYDAPPSFSDVPPPEVQEKMDEFYAAHPDAVEGEYKLLDPPSTNGAGEKGETNGEPQ